LQLIEIIQLALLIFIALGIMVFLSSYLGYRTKSRVKEDPKPPSEILKSESKESRVIDEVVEKPTNVKTQEIIKSNPRFEVFTPSSEEKVIIESEEPIKKKSHFPKTLIIKHKP
jgi:type IV secretory pathway VirB10-like protein